MNDNKKDDGLDLVGLGKIAKAIPPSVYTQSTKAVIDNFNKLVAPLTEATSGFGRYIRQKFDNMVDVEKALAAYSIQNAIAKAEAKANQAGTQIITPVHAKSFVKSVEEASKETDPFLHEMWENLLADQLINERFHPHFVEILPHFSPSEAKLLTSLLGRNEIGENGGPFIISSDDSFQYWVRKSGEKELNVWNYSCVLLCEFRFAEIIAPRTGTYPKGKRITILYRTAAGDAFLSAVSG
jgi:hypothetical protein